MRTVEESLSEWPGIVKGLDVRITSEAVATRTGPRYMLRVKGTIRDTRMVASRAGKTGWRPVFEIDGLRMTAEAALGGFKADEITHVLEVLA